MIPVVRIWTPDEMRVRIAKFSELKGSLGGFPDSYLPGCEREIMNVIGFQPPESDQRYVSPMGADASEKAAIPISEGFNLGLARCKPGCGPLMHNHDTNETFTPITGRWRCGWNEGEAYECVEVGPYDVVSFPPGLARNFVEVTNDEPDQQYLLLFVVAGNAPKAEFTPGAQAIIDKANGVSCIGQ
jgi:hypothetical protein